MTIRSGFVSIVGRPNVGKSTLLNAIIGQKIAIVSDKPQTTRNRIQGIYTSDEGQIIFVDTPGLHKPKHKLGEYMVDTTLATMKEVDLILYMADITAEFTGAEAHIINLISQVETPIIFVPNKIDLIGPGEVEARMLPYTGFIRFTDVVPISAARGTNIDTLLSRVFANLPEGPYYYPPDEITDVPERFIAAEIVREKVLVNTREEVPHSVAVEVEEFKEKREDFIYLRATIYCERDSQKGILIGAGGHMLKKIGQEARRELEALLGASIYLDLWVKVQKDWRDNEKQLKQFGYSLDRR